MMSSSLLTVGMLPNSILGITLTKQEFSGNLNLSEFNLTSILHKNSLPETSSYSGFIVYEDNGTILDWAIEIDDPKLNLSANFEATDNSDFPPTPANPNIDFQLDSPTDWELEIDFGIAFDAPRYTLEKTAETTISVTRELGMAGSYTYVDNNSTINQTVASLIADGVPIPESITILGVIVACAIGITVLKRKCFN